MKQPNSAKGQVSRGLWCLLALYYGFMCLSVLYVIMKVRYGEIKMLVCLILMEKNKLKYERSVYFLFNISFQFKNYYYFTYCCEFSYAFILFGVLIYFAPD